MVKKVGIIGAGPMGLACAFYLLRRGFAVDIYEQDDRIGGMSASFDFGGLTIERFYHFICKPDAHTLRLLRDLGIYNSLNWSETKMGFFYNGNLYRWGDPLSLLRFPRLGLLTKLRYGFHALYIKNIKSYDGLDKIEASRWIKKWIGNEGYDTLWSSLFYKKFYEYSHDISAAWIASRVQRVALSRKNIFTEQMGYLEGGTQTLLSSLRREIENLGGGIHLSSNIRKVRTKGKSLLEFELDHGPKTYDIAVSTIPLPYVPHIFPDLPGAYREKITGIANIGVVCVIYRLKRRLTENFWLNINDPSIDAPGIIEYSNLRRLKEAVVYVPYYVPHTHPLWNRKDETYVEKTLDCLHAINHEFEKDWVLGSAVFRYEYAQPVFTPSFYDKIPDYRSGLSSLYIADTTHSYPEDRSINESVRIAGEICDLILSGHSP